MKNELLGAPREDADPGRDRVMHGRDEPWWHPLDETLDDAPADKPSAPAGPVEEARVLDGIAFLNQIAAQVFDRAKTLRAPVPPRAPHPETEDR